jgi:membrane fusion protein, multidrug efflux system
MQDDIRDNPIRYDQAEPRVADPHIGPEHQLPPPRRSSSIRILVWLIILVAFGLLFWWTMHQRQAPSTRPAGGRRGAAGGGPVNLSVATAKKGDIGVYLDAIGTVTPVYTASVTSQVTGQITEVHYREGQLVRQGDPLVEIDSRPYRAQLLVAQGALERDTNLLAQARMDLARYQAASARDAIARQTLEDQEKVVLQEQGTVKADQGTVDYDQVQVGYCHITSPISGRVGLRLIDPGNQAVASSTTPLVVVTQLRPITVVFTIPEDSVDELEDQLRHAKALEVDAYDRSGVTKLEAGRLQSTDNQIDTTTGTLKLRAVFANSSNMLFPNLFVNARLLLKTLQNVVLIPTSAIQHNGDIAYVFLIQDDTAHLHNINPGVSESGMTEVEGLNAGDVIADSSFEKLQDGAKVIVSKRSLLPSNNESNAP